MVPYATVLIPIYVVLNAVHSVPVIDGTSWAGSDSGNVPAPVRDIHDADLVRIGAARKSRKRPVDGSGPSASSATSFCPPSCRHRHSRALRLPRGLERLPGAPDPDQPDRGTAAPSGLVIMRQQTMGLVDFGSTEAGVVVMAIPCIVFSCCSSGTTFAASCPEPSRADRLPCHGRSGGRRRSPRTDGRRAFLALAGRS